ncbi:Crp/Fnr family transcriptional regulator [Rufibacter latericius]|uniref:Cyclic nucleotide-binding domain-containing protein n=1 Tax=Rufibacter latericius TaxID=2487040 RepID=A0A3M9M9X2_9BACT|nr:cyclic nucleotide-binding domain-containing protein [Rufibacter latericius]RNI21977.1 cyclic nucleotide-binding domain-containing protein [Rufibacter latericius]
MLLIEKVLTLRASEIFSETPEPELVELAGVLEEIHLPPGSNLFSKGEMGDCMYIIYKGRVKIHDQEHTFAELEENELLGELSILDTEPRSASVTTLEDTILLKLAQEPFYEILLNNAEVLKGILKTLCRRLRQMDARMVSTPLSSEVDLY